MAFYDALGVEVEDLVAVPVRGADDVRPLTGRVPRVPSRPDTPLHPRRVAGTVRPTDAEQHLTLRRRRPHRRPSAGTDGTRRRRRRQAGDDELTDLLVGLADPLADVHVRGSADGPVELSEAVHLDTDRLQPVPAATEDGAGALGEPADDLDCTKQDHSRPLSTRTSVPSGPIR